MLLKVETQEGLLRRLRRKRRPTIVCGDFNSPKHEGLDGIVTPFSGPRGERAVAAEMALMGRINACGLVDAFRHCQGYEADGRSWYWKNKGRTDGFRLDHIFASPSLRVETCDYVHTWRESGLSDHSPIYADIALSSNA